MCPESPGQTDRPGRQQPADLATGIAEPRTPTADFYPLLANAVARLEHNTAEARRAVYARARRVLADRLRPVNPHATGIKFSDERVALEDAIFRLELEFRTAGTSAARRRETSSGPRSGEERAKPDGLVRVEAGESHSIAAAEPVQREERVIPRQERVMPTDRGNEPVAPSRPQRRPRRPVAADMPLS